MESASLAQNEQFADFDHAQQRVVVDEGKVSVKTGAASHQVDYSLEVNITLYEHPNKSAYSSIFCATLNMV